MEFLFSPFTSLARTGPKIAQMLENLTGGNRIIDLLYHLPSSFHHKKYLPKLYEVNDGDIVIVKVKIEAHLPPAKKSQPFKVRCFSPSGYLNLVFFKIYPNYIEKNFPLGKEVILSGKINRFNGELQMSHPDYISPENLIEEIPKEELIYPLSAGISQKFLRAKISEILSKLNDISLKSKWPEWLDKNLLQKNSWPNFISSLISLHNPQGSEALNPESKARKRLAYDELLASQIASRLTKRQMSATPGRAIFESGILQKKILADLPFELTAGQKKVLAQIKSDLASDKKMFRLLQGDVGSGKTIVAFLAMLAAAEAGKQSALIVPISLLANQHFNNFEKLAKNLNIKIALLTGKTTKKQKQQIIKDLKSGAINIIIGTHALIYPEIIFNDLALIVIDEQHRFGVLQRLELIKKGQQPDVLLMSATPIPRSLMMTLYSDMDISILDEKPINRTPIDTRVLSLSRLDEIYQAIERAIKNGEKIYWICPLVEEAMDENDEPLYANITERFALFKEKFGAEKVALIHGKMKEKEKDLIMEKFVKSDGPAKILVATTVIEVGIDVKEATIMIVENCEKFGLSQLHQLRGRVGRGSRKSFCLLLYGKAIGENGKKRLSIMRETDDGFRIAEEDLKMRGFGQILGTRQSGLPSYKIANLMYDSDLLATANRNAELILNKNQNFQNDSGIKMLLQIFNYQDCVKWLS